MSTDTSGTAGASGQPQVVDRATFEAELTRLRRGRRRTPARATRSPPPAGGYRWSRWTPTSRWSGPTDR